jgi:hypothetical protein
MLSQISLREIVPILQVAVGPVILISGIGLLLLSMTNRFGRVIDRSRQLAVSLRSATMEERAIVTSQIAILSRRALLVRRAIVLATLSMLCAAVLVITLFVAALLGWESAVLAVTLFVCCLVCLIAALVVFLQDINLSLAALKLEIAARQVH